MEHVGFFIDKIRYGWFDVSLRGGKWQIAVSASDVWGTDTPALFLQGLVNQGNEKFPSSIYVDGIETTSGLK